MTNLALPSLQQGTASVDGAEAHRAQHTPCVIPEVTATVRSRPTRQIELDDDQAPIATPALAPEVDAAPLRANRTSKAQLLARAKNAVECGEISLKEAAEALGLAQADHGATQREMAEAIGKSAAWVNKLLKWRRSGYSNASPFGPTTMRARVEHAKQRARSGSPRKVADGIDGDRRTKSAEKCSDEQTPSAATPTSAPPAPPASMPAPRRRSPSEAKNEFRFAIDQWWPLLDEAGRAEIVSYFAEKTKSGAS